MSDSPRYSLSVIDWKKVGIGLLVALGGALLTYVQELVPEIDFGDLTPLVAALNAVLINFLRKWLAQY